MKSFSKFLAETTFYARRTHPAQHLLPTKKDEQPIKTKNKWTRAEFKRKDRKVRSSSKKEPISKDEVQSAKKYLKVHDLALVGDNQQISFKQYLADQNETEGEKLAKEGSKLHQRRPNPSAPREEREKWKSDFNDFQARNAAHITKGRPTVADIRARLGNLESDGVDDSIKTNRSLVELKWGTVQNVGAARAAQQSLAKRSAQQAKGSPLSSSRQAESEIAKEKADRFGKIFGRWQASPAGKKAKRD